MGGLPIIHIPLLPTKLETNNRTATTDYTVSDCVSTRKMIPSDLGLAPGSAATIVQTVADCISQHACVDHARAHEPLSPYFTLRRVASSRYYNRKPSAVMLLETGSKVKQSLCSPSPLENKKLMRPLSSVATWFRDVFVFHPLFVYICAVSN